MYHFSNMDKNHFCYEPFNFKENLFHDRHWYLSFLFFPMILWNFYYRNHILRVWTFPPKASRRRGRETWQVRLIPIEFFRYALHVPTYSRYLDRFTWLSYIHYIYILHCALASLWRYIYRVIELCTHHRTYKTSVKLFLSHHRGRTNFCDSNGDSCWSRD